MSWFDVYPEFQPAASVPYGIDSPPPEDRRQAEHLDARDRSRSARRRDHIAAAEWASPDAETLTTDTDASEGIVTR